MGRRSVGGCGAMVRMNRPGFPETVLFEPPQSGTCPAVAVLAERCRIDFTDIVKRPTTGSPRRDGFVDGTPRRWTGHCGRRQVPPACSR